MKKILSVIVVGLVLTGCVSIGSNRDKINPEFAYENIVKNKTTKEDVLAIFGHPDNIKELGRNQEEWTYAAQDGLSILDLAQQAVSVGGSLGGVNTHQASRAVGMAASNADKLKAQQHSVLDIRFKGDKATSYRFR